jgi:hypothetical protein
VKRERDEDGVPGEEIGPGDGVEHLACVIDSPGTRVEGDELGGEEVGWCHGRDDEAGVELAAGGKVAGVGAALDKVAVRPRVRRHGGEPRRQLHSLFMKGFGGEMGFLAVLSESLLESIFFLHIIIGKTIAIFSRIVRPRDLHSS